MINLDIITNGNNKKRNENLAYIPHHQHRILIIGGFESGKTNTLLNYNFDYVSKNNYSRSS